jgi:hypothetical protein
VILVDAAGAAASRPGGLAGLLLVLIRGWVLLDGCLLLAVERIDPDWKR